MARRLAALSAFALGLLACEGPPIVTTAMPAPQPAPVVSTAYVIAPGNALDVKFFYNPDLNEALEVRPDGFVTLQLVGDVQASGRTPAELAAELREAFASHIPHPEVSVIVRKGSPQQIYVGGEVATPGFLKLDGPMTSLQALMASGGAKTTARLSQVVLIRYLGSNEATIERVDLAGVLDGEAPDVLLRPYDVIFVPMTPIAQVNVFVDQYINKIIPSQMSFPYNLNTSYKVVN